MGGGSGEGTLWRWLGVVSKQWRMGVGDGGIGGGGGGDHTTTGYFEGNGGDCKVEVDRMPQRQYSDVVAPAMWAQRQQP